MAVGKVFLFDPFTAAMQGLTIWIDYLGYASMHFCQILVMLIFSGFDSLVMMSYRSSLKAQLQQSTFLKTIYYTILAFTCVKALFLWFCYSKYKRVFKEVHGHMHPCKPVQT